MEREIEVRGVLYVLVFSCWNFCILVIKRRFEEDVSFSYRLFVILLGILGYNYLVELVLNFWFIGIVRDNKWWL